jgi:hypothetical protein
MNCKTEAVCDNVMKYALIYEQQQADAGSQSLICPF